MKVLVAESIAEQGIERLKTDATVDIKTKLTPDELVATIGDYEALVVRSQTNVSARVIEAGKKLQVIARAGVGVDNIDLEAATRCGVVVVNAPTGNTISAAEHTIALMLAMVRNIPQGNSSLKAGEWRRKDFIGTEVRNKTVGIVGLGKVGSAVARRALGLEMRVIAHDPFVSSDYARNLGVELVSLDELLKESDFVTVHTPLTKATTSLIGAKELTLVKPTTRFINTARGGIINEEALVQAIEEGRIAGAAIDVFSEEPPGESNLVKNEKILVTPHLGASTAEAQINVALDVADQILAISKGQPARYAVNAPLMTPETRSTLIPFLDVASQVGRLATQLAEGQLGDIRIKYNGEIANYDTSVVKAAVIGGLLEPISEERVNLINANLIAANRGLKIVEEKDITCENYSSLLTVEVTTSAGVTRVAGTPMRGESHIVLVNNYWVDIIPTPGFWLFSDHRDRPGLIGVVGTITGNADIDISFMQVSRLKPQGQALMILGLDEALSDEDRQKILAIPDIYTAKLVKL